MLRQAKANRQIEHTERQLPTATQHASALAELVFEPATAIADARQVA
jgi:hypothetical protein